MANSYSAFKQGQNKSLYMCQRKTTRFTSEYIFLKNLKIVLTKILLISIIKILIESNEQY